jgi:hypothetical protein
MRARVLSQSNLLRASPSSGQSVVSARSVAAVVTVALAVTVVSARTAVPGALAPMVLLLRPKVVVLSRKVKVRSTLKAMQAKALMALTTGLRAVP